MERLTDRQRNFDGTASSPKSLVIEEGMRKGMPSAYCGAIVTKLADYEDADEQGLLLKLPCKVGDKVWAVTSTANYSLGEYREVPLKHPQEKKIQSITITKNGLLYHVKDRTYIEKDFGETVFLTKEKAEQALKNM